MSDSDWQAQPQEPFLAEPYISGKFQIFIQELSYSFLLPQKFFVSGVSLLSSSQDPSSNDTPVC